MRLPAIYLTKYIQTFLKANNVHAKTPSLDRIGYKRSAYELFTLSKPCSLKKKDSKMDIIQSENDPRQYKTITLKNGLKALLIHDPISTTAKSDSSERLSAAALCVGAGSFSDPIKLPGLAHFLEHMVFMGSKKFPEENDFDAYVKQHGGSSNAYTDCERTVFYFDVKQEDFFNSLDKFAQFFIHPLMKKDSVDRELQAVDSEYSSALTSDKNRLEQLLGSFAKSHHPMAKFMWGNLKSLKSEPEKAGIDVYEELRAFHKRHYSSHYMTLTIQSRMSIDLLEKEVVKIFSLVPHNNQDQADFTETKFQEPFSSSGFNKLYKAVPVKNMHQIVIWWALPPLLLQYSKKPLNYIGFLLGHEGKGSILSYLKKRFWATGIEGGNSESNFEMNSTWSGLSISVTATEEGINHEFEILSAVFDYLKALQQSCPCERIFNEIKTVEETGFRFCDQVEPVDYVERLCENMQLYPSQHVLTGDRLLQEYDPQLIQKCIQELVPEKANILFYSKKYDKDEGCTDKEPWFRVKYSTQDIPKDWFKTWQDNDLNPEFHLPEENSYIASDFNIKPVEERHKLTFPTKLNDSDQSRLWYKKDTKFNNPKGYIYFMLKTGIFQQSAINAVMGDMITRILDHNLTEVAYAGGMAGLDYDFKCIQHKGFELTFKGFNHKLPKLFSTVMDYLANLKLDNGTFEMIKNQLKRSYYNNYIKPTNLALQTLYIWRLVFAHRWA